MSGNYQNLSLRLWDYLLINGKVKDNKISNPQLVETNNPIYRVPSERQYKVTPINFILSDKQGDKVFTEW